MPAATSLGAPAGETAFAQWSPLGQPPASGFVAADAQNIERLTLNIVPILGFYKISAQYFNTNIHSATEQDAGRPRGWGQERGRGRA